MFPRVAIIILFAFTCNVNGDDSDYYYDTDAVNDDLGNRIVGGAPIEITNAPYQVSLELQRHGNYEHWCGASIISRTWILTAAHCIKGIAKDRFRVRAGSTYIERGGTLHHINKYKTHENYNRTLKDYDVAVMKTVEPFQYSNKVRPIALASMEPAYGKQVWVSGWGRTSYRGSLSPQLQVVDLKILSRGPCNVAYDWSISARMICALDPKGGKDSCQGDSGGPLVVDKKLAGIVSWGKKCAEKGVPGIYTNVKVFKDWIEKSIDLDHLPLVGPMPVGHRRYPYQLSLEEKQNEGFIHKCGAAIIDKWWAITAAHCVFGKVPRDFQLRSGTNFLGEGEMHKVKTVIVHPIFNMYSKDFDIALLQVSTPFNRDKSKGVKAIPLATETPAIGSRGMVTGWGTDKQNRYNFTELNHAKLFILHSVFCYHEYPYHITIQSILCADSHKQGKDSCPGDPGGPLVVDGKLAGIISTEGCAQNKKPVVMANVAFLRYWIIAKMLQKT